MKKLIVAITSMVMLFSGVSMASSHHKTSNERVQGTVVSSTAIIQDVIKQVPQQSCQMVDVPIYSQSGGASTGDVLAGAIVGGVIGNQFGKGSGKDAATVLGAIIGADKANKNKQTQTIVGYKQVQQCSTTYVNQTSQHVVGYSTVVDSSMGTYTFQTQNKVATGTILFLNVKVSLD